MNSIISLISRLFLDAVVELLRYTYTFGLIELNEKRDDDDFGVSREEATK